MIGSLVNSRLFRDDWRRRGIAAVLIVILAIAAYFPQTYKASSTVVTSEPSSMGLGGVLGQTSAFNSAFANTAALEVALNVGRSQHVREIVAKRLNLVNRLGFSDIQAADRWLEGAVDVTALRGGLIEIQVKNRDPELALALVKTVTEATRDRLGEIARSQTAYKREVIENLLRTSYARLDRARTIYDTYRRTTGNTSPQAALGAIGVRVPQIREALKAKEIQLRTAQAFATDENMNVRRIQVEMQVLRQQLAEAMKPNPNAAFSVDRVVTETTKVKELEREFVIAQTQYDAYRMFFEGTAVEDMTSNANMRILRAAYIDADRQYRVFPAALALLVILLAITAEVYLMRPPISEVRARSEREA